MFLYQLPCMDTNDWYCVPYDQITNSPYALGSNEVSCCNLLVFGRLDDKSVVTNANNVPWQLISKNRRKRTCVRSDAIFGKSWFVLYLYVFTSICFASNYDKRRNNRAIWINCVLTLISASSLLWSDQHVICFKIIMFFMWQLLLCCITCCLTEK